MSKQYNKLHDRGLASALSSVQIEDGKIRLTIDTGQLFFDIGTDKRVEISDFVADLTEEEILSTLAPLPKFYWATDTLNIFRYTSKGWENILRKYFSTSITGDGVKTEFVVTHNLNITNVKLTMKDSNNTICLIDYDVVDNQSIKLKFAEAPDTTDTYNIVVSIL